MIDLTAVIRAAEGASRPKQQQIKELIWQISLFFRTEERASDWGYAETDI